MSLLWVVCGAGRQVGKTRVAQRLCEILPDAVYAKQGHGEKRPGKPDNFYHAEHELAAFVAKARQMHEHIVVESNELTRAGRGEIIIFVDGIPGVTDYRADAEFLCSRSHLHTGPRATRTDWQRVLRERLPSAGLHEAICNLLADQRRFTSESSPALRGVEPLRLSTEAGGAVPDPGHVIIEAPVTVVIEDVGSFTLMCTPCDLEALVVGFAFSRGMISSMADVIDYSYRPERQAVGLRIEDPQRATRRNLLVTGTCGLSGSRNIETLLARDTPVGDSLHVSASLLRDVVQHMHARQVLFRRSGGAHGAGVFDANGELIAMAEDIGRHNALDKALGKCLLRGVPLESRGAALSGRISLELVAKAARAGLEILAAVSAPSSLAIEAAERCNITLCGFVRVERATVYTHPQRIEGLQEVKREK